MILHICGAEEWSAVPADGEYRAPSLETEGYIHCSDPGTVALPANVVYVGRTDLLLLEIDPAKVGVPVRWEDGNPPSPAGIWFPHVYGAIPRAAVVGVHEFPAQGDGTFVLPDTLAQR